MTLSVLLAGVLALPVQAAPVPEQSPLAPGTPAGVNQAQLDRSTVAVEVGAAALVAGFALAFAHLAFTVTQTGVSLGSSAAAPALGSTSAVSSTSTR